MKRWFMIAACWSLLFAVLGQPTMAQAKVFKNSFLQFDLPDDWTCVLANTEWICNPINKAQSREAVLVIAAKAAGPEDNFESFQKNLATPRTIQSRIGAPVESKVLQVKQVRIQGQSWLEALHFGSEIEEFYTQYLVTVKEQLSILVSLSCQKATFTKYSSLFSRIIPTFRIIAGSNLLKKPLPYLNQPTTPAQPVAVAPNLPEEPRGPEKRPVIFWFLIGLSVLVVTLFIFALKGDSSDRSSRKRSRDRSKPR
jgi:hypothetical protein